MRLTFDKLDNTPGSVTGFLTHLLPNPYTKVSTKYVRSQLVNGKIFLKAGDIYGGRTNAGVVQDKKPPWRLTAATAQPATASNPAVGEKGGSATAVATAPEYKLDTQPAVNRPSRHGSETRRTDQVTGRVSPVLKTQLLQLAGKQGAKSESSAVKMAVEVFVANEFGTQFLVMIRQTIQETVRQEFQAYTNRFGKLTFASYLAAEQGRLLQIDNFRSALDPKDVGALPQKIKDARKQAWENLKFYNHSLQDIEKAASETVPWQ
jgi:hypothetical protein